MLRELYALTKPGIVYGNMLTAAAGFFIASSSPEWLSAGTMLIGISCIVAAGCVFNNYIDRDIDGLMERTKNRPLVKGTVTLHDALSFGILLALLGSVFLYFANLLSLAVALFGLFVYVIVYSVWCKRHTLHSTVIGAVAGAVPPVAGYAAASGTLDAGAALLFLILFTWQMPHALSIAIRRIQDYRNANIPIMPIVYGMHATKIQMLLYSIVFLAANTVLWFKGYAGLSYLFAMGFLSIFWIGLCARGFAAQDDRKWATQVFIFSQIIICAFCLFSGFEMVLP